MVSLDFKKPGTKAKLMWIMSNRGFSWSKSLRLPPGWSSSPAAVHQCHSIRRSIPPSEGRTWTKRVSLRSVIPVKTPYLTYPFGHRAQLDSSRAILERGKQAHRLGQAVFFHGQKTLRAEERRMRWSNASCKQLTVVRWWVCSGPKLSQRKRAQEWEGGRSPSEWNKESRTIEETWGEISKRKLIGTIIQMKIRLEFREELNKERKSHWRESASLSNRLPTARIFVIYSICASRHYSKHDNSMVQMFWKMFELE